MIRSCLRDSECHLGLLDDSDCYPVQNAVFVRADVAAQLDQSSLGPDSVNRLYLDALSLNWNDLLLNIAATRRGAPDALVQAEMAQFGAPKRERRGVGVVGQGGAADLNGVVSCAASPAVLQRVHSV